MSKNVECFPTTTMWGSLRAARVTVEARAQRVAVATAAAAQPKVHHARVAVPVGALAMPAIRAGEGGRRVLFFLRGPVFLSFWFSV